ncbi:MAG: carbon monoxide dehydrogenase subunit G [Pseudomonadales bacterium]
MEQTGEYRIAADRDAVWAALNDPEVLSRCIDGCEALEKTADDRFDARIKAKVGPVRATFDAELRLEEVVPPASYTLSGNVKGGAAGFARGSAKVNLTEDGSDTVLAYQVNGNVGGKLAQVGSRLIDGAARKMAEDFFARFRREFGGDEETAEGATAAAAAEPRVYESGGRWMIWLVAFTALLLALLFAF